jgi:hypothetical protein
MAIPIEQIGVFREATRNVLNLRLQEREVTAYWGVIFSPKGIASLTKQDMTGFLRYEQNKRWKDISKEDVTRDMEALRSALLELTNDEKPVATRLNNLEPGRGELAVPHLGKAKLSAILLVTKPKDYGVWNDYSERALRGMGVMPNFDHTLRLGDQYAMVNEVLITLAREYRLSMWWLDIILEQIARLVRP